MNIGNMQQHLKWLSPEDFLNERKARGFKSSMLDRNIRMEGYERTSDDRDYAIMRRLSEQAKCNRWIR